MDVLDIEFAPNLQEWIDHRLGEGRHVDAAEYLRDLVRRDMRMNADCGVDRNTQTEGL